jgi:hypothetical protein
MFSNCIRASEPFGNDQQILIECPQLQRSEPDVFDSTNSIADLAEITDPDFSMTRVPSSERNC